MQIELEESLREFISSNSSADLIEAVVDSTVGPEDSFVPVLNLWAWKVTSGQNLQDALQKVTDTEDEDFLEDILEEISSQSCELADFYPDWPENLGEGDMKVLQLLKSSVGSPSTLSDKTAFLFRHIGAWPPVDVLKAV